MKLQQFNNTTIHPLTHIHIRTLILKFILIYTVDIAKNALGDIDMHKVAALPSSS